MQIRYGLRLSGRFGGGLGRCRRARPPESLSNSNNQRTVTRKHSPGARALHTRLESGSLVRKTSCFLVYWCTTCLFLFRPLESWPCHSSCSPALTVFRSCPSSFCVELLVVTLFRTRVYYRRKLTFETVSELFEQRKTDTRLQLCAVSCLNQNEHVLYTLHFA